MTSFKIFAALAVLSATAATPAFSRTLQGVRHNYAWSGTHRAGGTGSSWCLHNYSSDEIDCSYADQSQCAATASGGLGECEMKR
jgi:hypothetical protein